MPAIYSLNPTLAGKHLTGSQPTEGIAGVALLIVIGLALGTAINWAKEHLIDYWEKRRER